MSSLLDGDNNKSIENNTRYLATRKVTLIGAVTNILLAGAQILGGLLTHSQALLADGAHTLSDLATDIIVLITAKMASKDADEDHPYGHGRYETAATIILGIILSLVAVGIAYDSITRLFNPEQLLKPEPLGIFFALLAIISKESLFHYTKQVANQINSPMLHANAWHHRSDAISSLVVLIGIAGAVFLHIPWLDAAAAIIVSIMIFTMGAKMLIESIMELVDTALDPEKVEKIHQFISNIDGVNNVHMLRTRQMAGRAIADVHIQVDSYISVSEGHHIAERVMYSLSGEFPELQDITVHVDPEDDECSSPCRNLPSRANIMSTIEPAFDKIGLSQRDKITLHYLDGKTHIEINLETPTTEAQIKELQEICASCPELSNVSIYQHIT